MTTALIVAGVVVFLIVDAFIIYKVFARQRADDDLGILPLPGETTVDLPAGKVRISYQEERRAPSSEDDIHFSTPAGFSVRVTSPSGAELELKGPGFRGMGSSQAMGLSWTRTLVGTVEVTEPGPHTVSAPAEMPADAVEPKLLIGK